MPNENNSLLRFLIPLGELKVTRLVLFYLYYCAVLFFFLFLNFVLGGIFPEAPFVHYVLQASGIALALITSIILLVLKKPVSFEVFLHIPALLISGFFLYAHLTVISFVVLMLALLPFLPIFVTHLIMLISKNTPTALKFSIYFVGIVILLTFFIFNS